ncbi:hypothetical protein LVJ94_51635 [Pendulispora rubella]|uniref:Uncharacterized protein n=1 Tax=Pendulispora rubella TaxID=2741070 RepID=A0ABZ2L719_9BACT
MSSFVHHRLFALGAFGLLGIALGSGACSSDPDGNGDKDFSGRNVSSGGYQANDQCPVNPPSALPGTRSASSSCTSYMDCAPSCCACASSSASYLAAACIDGVCADKADTCYVGKKPTYCPADSDPGPSPKDGGTSGKDVNPPPSGGTLCVDGTSGSCIGTGFDWTGSQCCVKNVSQCVDGTSGSCVGTGYKWTGKQCCIEKDAVCTAGTSGSCIGTGYMWTGSQCCVQNVSQCVDGTSGSCIGTGYKWTGSQCCIEKDAICTSGTSGSCIGTNFMWTGSQCCVQNVSQCVDGTSGSCTGTGKYWTGTKCCI